VSNVYPLKCRIRAEAAATRVDVYDDIGGDSWFGGGISAADFASQLTGLKGTLEVHINSAGGDVFDGLAISNAIRAHKGRVTTMVDGLAASIASVIAQAGQDRVVQPGGMLMIHDAFGACAGNAGEMTAMAATLGKVSDNIASVYAGRSGRTQDFWRSQMRDETWYTAEEAVAAGLADRVGDGDAALPAGLDLAALGSVPGRIAARLRSLPQAAASDADDAPVCPDCNGKKTVKHPSTGKFTKCATCGGSGVAPDPDAGSDADAGDSAAGKDDGKDDDDKDLPFPGAAPPFKKGNRAPRRILGIESMPILDKAIAVHHTPTVDTPWDGPAAVAAMPAEYADLHYCHAWQTAEADASSHTPGDGDVDDLKSSFKFPHHAKDGGPANLGACRNGLARMSGADIPPADDAGVQAHLNAHLSDGGSGGSADHAHHDLSGISPEQLRAALKGAGE
jgi:ATP-dependent protease ClpP protease subunit